MGRSTATILGVLFIAVTAGGLWFLGTQQSLEPTDSGLGASRISSGDSNSKSSRQALTVTYKPLWDRPPMENGGVFIGLNEFQTGSGLPQLAYAVNDAVAQAHLFVVNLKLIAPRNCVLVLSGSPLGQAATSQLSTLASLGVQRVGATKSQITQTFDRLPKRDIDLFIVGVNTHALEAEDKTFLMPADGSNGEAASEAGLPVEWLDAACKRLNARNELWIMDICRDQNESPAGTIDRGMTYGMRQAMERNPKRFVLAACDIGQTSRTDDAARQGAFTRSLIAAFSEAHSDERGIVTLRNVGDFVVLNTLRWASANDLAKGVQQPWLRTSNSSRVLTLAQNPNIREAYDRFRKSLAQVAEDLKARVTIDGEFIQPVYDQVATVLASSEYDREGQELLTNAESFLAGRVTEAKFVQSVIRYLDQDSIQRAKSLQALLRTAKERLDAGNWDQALAKLDELDAMDPGNAQAAKLRDAVQTDRQNAAQAAEREAMLAEATEAAKEDRLEVSRLVLTAQEAGARDDAAALWKASQAAIESAEASFKEGNFEDAAKSWEQAKSLLTKATSDAQQVAMVREKANAERLKIFRQAQESGSLADVARKRAADLNASTHAADQWTQAEQLLPQAKQQFKDEDYKTAEDTWRQTIKLYEQATKIAETAMVVQRADEAKEKAKVARDTAMAGRANILVPAEWEASEKLSAEALADYQQEAWKAATSKWQAAVDAYGKTLAEAERVVALRKSADESQRQLVTARQSAAQAMASTYASELWLQAEQLYTNSQKAFLDEDWTRSHASAIRAIDLLERATATAKSVLQQRITDAESARKSLTDSRTTAEGLNAAKITPDKWSQAAQLADSANAAYTAKNWDAYIDMAGKAVAEYKSMIDTANARNARINELWKTAQAANAANWSQAVAAVDELLKLDLSEADTAKADTLRKSIIANYRPKPSGTLIVSTDRACEIIINGEDTFTAPAAGSWDFTKLAVGDRKVLAVSGLYSWESTVSIREGQTTRVSAAFTAAPTISNSIGMPLTFVRPGSFTMGSQDDATVRVQLTNPMYFGRTEVTRGQFAAFVRESNYRTEAETDGGAWIVVRKADQWVAEKTAGASWRNPGFTQGDDHPVTCVSWNDAVAFCNWLSRKENRTYRIPTEAEWEYACRAGTQSTYSFGNRDADLARNGNYCDQANTYDFFWRDADHNDGFSQTAPVGSYPANPWGLADMHGNVYEWCADWHGDLSTSPQVNPRGPQSGSYRVIRGGSWYNVLDYCQSAARGNNAPNVRNSDLGFRVVLELTD